MCIYNISPISEVNISSGICFTNISKLSSPWSFPQSRWNMNLMFFGNGLPNLPWTWYGINKACTNLLLTFSWNQVISSSVSLYLLQLARIYQSNMHCTIGHISLQPGLDQKDMYEFIQNDYLLTNSLFGP